MSVRRYASARDELTKLVGDCPPVAPYDLRGGTRLTGRWNNGPYEGYVAPMREHVVAATFHGSGHAFATVDGKKSRALMSPGSITLAPRGHDGHWRIAGRIVVTNVYLEHRRLVDYGDQVAEGRAFELLDRVNQSDPKLFWIMGLIAQEIERPQHHSLLFLEQAVDALCLQLIRGHSNLGNPLCHMQRGLARWQVKRVSDYMLEHVDENVTLQELADLIGMSRFHFCSAFRLATGSPPHEYLTRLRIRVACDLLRSQRLPIKSVALAVGYATPSAFSATFRKAIGTTPRQYRRSC